MLDTRRAIRATPDEPAERLEQTALHGAATGVVRDLVSQMVR
jgi:hypothetical protein